MTRRLPATTAVIASNGSCVPFWLPVETAVTVVPVELSAKRS